MDVRIFELPIYGVAEKQFRGKWDAHINKEVDEWVKTGWNREEALAKYKRLVFPKTIWKYAQIIGFLTVDISASDIVFEIFAPIGQQYRYNTSQKLNIQCWSINGQHFRVEDSMSNDEITKEIYLWIDGLKKDFLKKWYLDTSVFDNTTAFIDYRGIIEKIRAN